MAATRKAAARTRAAVIPFPQTGRIEVVRLLPSWRVLAVAFAVVGLAAGAYSAARFTPIFAVRSVEVRGAPPAVAAEVRTRVTTFEGTSLLAVDLGALGARVLELPTVAAVRWDRAFPNGLVATIEPERPAAILRRGSESWLVSERGRIMRAVERGELGGLPRIWVPQTVGVEVGARLRETPVVSALRALRPLPVDFPVRVRSVTAGDALVFDLETGLELRLGSGLDLPLKLAVAASVAPSLPVPAEGGPDYLDVSVPERPVTGTNSQVDG